MDVAVGHFAHIASGAGGALLKVLQFVRQFSSFHRSQSICSSGIPKWGRTRPDARTNPCDLASLILRVQAGANLVESSGMRAVIQRVTEASVVINGALKSCIKQGLVALVAVEESDTEEDIEWLSGKIVRLRVFNDENGVMNKSIQEMQGELLAVSQFTLFASTRKGNRPSYSRSARPEIAIPIYEKLIARLTKDVGKPVQTGEFGADMKVSLINDGPVTIIIDTKLRQ